MVVENNRPRLGIVGRPNVGKSTLFNRLAGRPVALVRNEPGITRDWQEIVINVKNLTFCIVDTAGLVLGEKEGLMPLLQDATVKTLENVQGFLLVVDAREGITASDVAYASFLRPLGKPVIVVVNKCDGPHGNYLGLSEAYALGFKTVVGLSAQHALGMQALEESLRELFFPHSDKKKALLDAKRKRPHQEEEDIAVAKSQKALRVTIIGRPNVGKSTLMNAFLGFERVLTGPQAGLTRDSIAVSWESPGGRVLELVDTSGVRRLARITAPSEHMAVEDTWSVLERAHIAIMVVDAGSLLEKQDLFLLSRLAEEGRGVILALNKWDKIERPTHTLEGFYGQVATSVAQLSGLPCIPISALHEQGLLDLEKAIFAVEKIWKMRISTGILNQWIHQAVGQHPPPRSGTFRPKIKYITQLKDGPPTFAVFGNRVASLPDDYTRYLTNSLREAFDIWGVPIRFAFREPKNPYHQKRKPQGIEKAKSRTR